MGKFLPQFPNRSKISSLSLCFLGNHDTQICFEFVACALSAAAAGETILLMGEQDSFALFYC